MDLDCLPVMVNRRVSHQSLCQTQYTQEDVELLNYVGISKALSGDLIERWIGIEFLASVTFERCHLQEAYSSGT